MFTYTFLAFFVVFDEKYVLIIFKTFFDKISNFRNRMLTSQKTEFIFPLIPKESPLPSAKILFLRLSSLDDELLITPKSYNIPSIAITETPRTFSIKCYSITTMLPLFFITVFHYANYFSVSNFLCKILKKIIWPSIYIIDNISN